MVIRFRKLFESLTARTAAKQEDSSELKELDDNVIDADDVQVTEVMSLEDMVDEKTKDLEDAREQIKHLSDTAYGSKPVKDDSRVKEALVQALKPEGELPLQTLKLSDIDKEETKANEAPAPPPPEIELSLQSLKISPEPEEQEQAKDTAAKPRAPEVKLPTDGGETSIASRKALKPENKNDDTADMISKIFNREDEAEDPLANLVASLPGATVKELLDDALELETMLSEWQGK